MSFRQIMNMALITAGTMFAVNTLVTVSPTARSFIRGSTPSNANGAAAGGTVSV